MLGSRNMRYAPGPACTMSVLSMPAQCAHGGCCAMLPLPYWYPPSAMMPAGYDAGTAARGGSTGGTTEAMTGGLAAGLCCVLLSGY